MFTGTHLFYRTFIRTPLDAENFIVISFVAHLACTDWSSKFGFSDKVDPPTGVAGW